MKKEINSVKILQGAVRASNEKGLFNEFIFFSGIKSLNREGYLRRGALIKQIQEISSLSESNIRLKISKLHKLGWIIRDSAGNISLKTYDAVWNQLGLTKKSGDNRKVFRIQCDNFEEFENLIYLKEIRDCLVKQSLKVSTAKVNLQPTAEDTERKPSVPVKIGKNKLSPTDLDKLFLSEQKSILNKAERSTINYDVALSCLGIAKLFGFKSTQKGYAIQQRLRELGWIRIERRILMLGEAEEGKKLPRACFISNKGIIYKQLPNKFIFTSFHNTNTKPIKTQNNIPSVLFEKEVWGKGREKTFSESETY